MKTDVIVAEVPVRILAAVRRRIPVRDIGVTWRPALDMVWNFLRQHPGLRTDGHNFFLYHHPENRDSPMDIDFGVEIIRLFEPAEEVRAIKTPAGRVASALHVGPYERLGETHHAIHAWAAANREHFAGKSWEIYGDWTDDPRRLETRVEYLLS